MTDIHIPTVTLNDQTILPAIGLGTYGLKGSAGADVIANALKIGYRLIDSAFNYENEGTVGEALRKSGVSRHDVSITSKLPGRHHHYREALETVEESLYRAQLDYYDLYLIHWPNPRVGLYIEAWQALIEAQKRGLIRSIGVSNFLPEHLEHLNKETGVTPSVNQIEIHPYFPQIKQRDFDKNCGIIDQSWSPLGRDNGLLQHPTLKIVAQRRKKTIPQIILRWHIEIGALPLPKSSSPERLLENLSIFDFSLTQEDMISIASLARDDGRRGNKDPAHYEEF